MATLALVRPQAPPDRLQLCLPPSRLRRMSEWHRQTRGTYGSRAYRRPSAADCQARGAVDAPLACPNLPARLPDDAARDASIILFAKEGRQLLDHPVGTLLGNPMAASLGDAAAHVRGKASPRLTAPIPRPRPCGPHGRAQAFAACGGYHTEAGMARVAVNKKGLDRDHVRLLAVRTRRARGWSPLPTRVLSADSHPWSGLPWTRASKLIAIEAERILSISQHGN